MTGFKNAVPGNVQSGDKPQEILFAFPTSLAPGANNFAPIVDCSKWISWHSWFGFDAGPANFLRVQVSWYDTNNAMIARDDFYINGQGGGGYIPTGQCFLRGPVKGDRMTVTVQNAGSILANFNYAIYGSLRVLTYVTGIEYPATGGIVMEYSTPIPGNTTVTIYMPLFSGQVNVGILTGGTNAQILRYRLLTGVNTSTIFDKTYLLATNNNPVDFGLTFTFPRQPVVMQLINSGANTNFFRTIIVAEEQQ